MSDERNRPPAPMSRAAERTRRLRPAADLHGSRRGTWPGQMSRLLTRFTKTPSKSDAQKSVPLDRLDQISALRHRSADTRFGCARNGCGIVDGVC